MNIRHGFCTDLRFPVRIYIGVKVYDFDPVTWKKSGRELMEQVMAISKGWGMDYD